MSLADKVLAASNDLPIHTEQPVHSGKVRSVYWLTERDSRRLIESQGYAVAPDAQLAVMAISDRISAFECIWHAEGGMHGVPGKGAALNAISSYWFEQFRQQGLARSHILDVPHPLVWIVQKAEPVMIEAIARQYITGSMWRAYAKGEREFCGIQIPDGLQRDQKLPELLITPSTKGILSGIPGVPEADDVNVTRVDIENNYRAFKFKQPEDIDRYEVLLKEGFALISQRLAEIDQVFVDTKFEFGYAKDSDGIEQLIYMDEVGTPDSSRIWDGEQFRAGNVVENSKEGFRQQLLAHFPEPDILLDKNRMAERTALARDNALPVDMLMDVSNTYVSIAEKITGTTLQLSSNPKAEIMDILSSRYQLIQ
ncbi:MAG: phosphoribosylaminoimidazolesuccinocarboxamide synthase [Pseudomonadales bacterium]|nr:phosphoribosylaminoimidazolesuccinocarboxamide synthase [Gammaproteobacteria bacterium]NNL57039.1 phosphoribosylaminoimidazolesuccinocarboxamide synthase [Pseudomonadales bacterium]